MHLHAVWTQVVGHASRRTAESVSGNHPHAGFGSLKQTLYGFPSGSLLRL